MSDYEFILRVLRLFGETDANGSVWWRTDSDYAPVTFLANVNDVFDWGTADCEPVTPENIEVFEQAVRDVQVATGKRDWSTPSDWVDLAVSRIRKRTPQRPVMDRYDNEIRALFVQ